MPQVFTIGHSTHDLEHFTALLKRHDITAVGDVRSMPYSRINPQFNREILRQRLNHANIAYVFLGKELGARSEDPSCYVNGKVQYELLAESELFRQGIERVRTGMQKYHLALMCAEKDPLDCHRTILVARRVFTLGVDVQHILAEGSIESHAQVLDRLLRQLDLPEKDIFRSHDELILTAYERQGARIAYTSAKNQSTVPTGTAAR